jgi:hypothetical protein
MIAAESDMTRLGQDASDSQILRAVAHAFMKFLASSFTPGKASETFKNNSTLVSRYVEQVDDQVEFVSSRSLLSSALLATRYH